MTSGLVRTPRIAPIPTPRFLWRACLNLVSLFGLLLLLRAAPALAAPGQPPIPEGFSLVTADPGVSLYRKDYPGGAPDYVQVVDLSAGASVLPMHGELTEVREGKGVYGGNDARFRSKTLRAYWQEANSRGDAFCVVNGQFFYMLEYPTRLPFSLKVNGEYLTDGYGINQFPDQKLILELWPGRADIRALTAENLYASTAPNIIAGITEEAPKRIKFAVGRTFVGVGDLDGDGAFETFYVFNSTVAKQQHAADTLRAFGAAKVMHLDGGGSTQLLCEGQDYIYSERLIPQAIAVYAAGESNPLQAEQPALEQAYTAPPGSHAPARMPAEEQASTSVEEPAQTQELPAAPVASIEPAAEAASPLAPDQSSQANSVALPVIAAVFTPPESAPAEAEPPVQAEVSLQNAPHENAALVEAPATGKVQNAAEIQGGPAQQPAVQAALQAPVTSAGLATASIQVTDIFIVPLVMSPVLLVLFLAIQRIRFQNY